MALDLIYEVFQAHIAAWICVYCERLCFLTSAEEEGIKIDLSYVQRLCKTVDAYSLLLSNGDTSSLDPGTINHCQGLPTQWKVLSSKAEKV